MEELLLLASLICYWIDPDFFGFIGLIIIHSIRLILYFNQEDVVQFEAVRFIPYIDADFDFDAVEDNEWLIETFQDFFLDKHTIEWADDVENRLLEKDMRRRRRLRCHPRKLKDQENPLKCRACFKTFGHNPTDVPLLLQCGHTYCSLCIRTSPKFSPFRDMNKKMSYRNCPACNIATRFEHFEDLRMNHTLYSALLKINFTSSGSFWIEPEIDPGLSCSCCYTDLSSRLARETTRVSPRCGHSFCERCCIALQNDLIWFECFACQAAVALPRCCWYCEVPKNYAVMELLEYM